MYATVIFIPARIFLELVVGGGSLPVAWFMLLLWVKFSQLFGKPLTKQEAYLVYMLAGIEFLPLTLVYRAWFKTAPIVTKFGLTDELPSWYFPPTGSVVYEARTLFHPDWIVPISLMLTWTVISTVLSISLGFVARELYVEVEDLPFPMEQVNSVAITSLTEGEAESSGILSIFGILGFSWGILVYAIPFLVQAWTGRQFQLIPIPWIDMTKLVEGNFPGAIFGLHTDIIFYATGLVIPFGVSASMAIGSLAVSFFGNWMTVAYNLGPDTDLAKPGYQSWYVPGMSLDLITTRSLMYFWFPIRIGLGLAVGIAPLLHHPRYLVNAISHLSNPFPPKGRRRSDVVSRPLIIVPLIVSLIAGTAVFAILVPDFLFSNIWFIPFVVLMPFLSTLIRGRTRGEAGVTVLLPVGSLQNMMFIFSGYQKADVWFAPSPMTNQGAGWLNSLKVAQLTGTSATSMIKAYLLLLPFTVVIGFTYVDLLWRTAPIPSTSYPGAQIYWPIDATRQTLWIRGIRSGMLNPMWILYSFIAGAGVYFAFALTGLPISYIGLAAGANMLPPLAMAIFVGGVVSKILSHRLGEKWRFMSRLVAAGLAMGESIAITISVAISLIMNSMWMLPF